MWIFLPNRSLWHCHDDNRPGAALCGTTVPVPGEGREQADRPAGFDGLLCNRCWFAQELAETLTGISDLFLREWLEGLDYSSLTDAETERLCGELGENRALSLVVIHGLAESADLEEAPQPISLPARIPERVESANLAVIPLVYRQETEAAPLEEEEEEAVEVEPASTEPRMKINCTRINSTNPGGGGFGRFLKRLGRSDQ
jgi:hypothetical protein